MRLNAHLDLTHDDATRLLAAERLALLYDITTQLQRASTIGDVADLFVHGVYDRLGAAVATLVMTDEDRTRALVLGSEGIDPETRDRYRIVPLNVQLPLIQTLRTGKALWIESRSEALSHFPLLEHLAPQDRRAYATVPLCRGDEILGAYGLGFCEDRTFDDAERQFHIAIAGQCAIALERALLFEREANARREAERALAARDEFLAVISHEVRTPLTSIMGWADLLLRDGHTDDPAMRKLGLESIRGSARVQRRLMDDLLDATRMLSATLRLEVSRIDCGPVIASVVTSFEPDAAQRQVSLDVALPDAPLPVDGDAGRIAQVLRNLISNALKFSDAGGKVRVSAIRMTDRLRIEVTDDGGGIDPEFLPRVFDRYARGQTDRDGLGLGLAIAHHLVVLHGGTLEAQSGGRGQGATFMLTLPLAS